MSAFSDELSELNGLADRFGNVGTSKIPATEPTQGGGYVANPPTSSGIGAATSGLDALKSASSTLTNIFKPSDSTTKSTAASTGTASDAAQAESGTFAGSTLENIVFILIGLLLIAAGVFSFRQTQTVLQTAGNITRKGAELAAL